jgi:protein TonB
MMEDSASRTNIAVASEWDCPGGGAAHDDDAGVCSVLALAIWFGCVVVGVLGLALPYARPKAPLADYPAIRAETLEVQLASVPQSVPMAREPSSSARMPPSAPTAASMPAPPKLLAVATPSVAFAAPVPASAKAFVSVEATADASHVQAIKPEIKEHASAKSSDQAAVGVNNGLDKSVDPSKLPPASGPPTARALTFGQGEGRQAAPAYPLLAVRGGQEGTVRIRFQVDEAGRITKAEVAEASPWPLLDESALRTVRLRWRFAPGAPRVYEVPILFQLKK